MNIIRNIILRTKSRFLEKSRERIVSDNLDGRIQVSNFTQFDRYPAIFSEVRKLLPGGGLRILSFGCSSGEELSALDRIYFRECEIDGVDIDPNILKQARKKIFENNVVNIFDYDTWMELDTKYNAIFAMSVLCRWPDSKFLDCINEIYRFEDFEKAIENIDQKLLPGGVLVIFNSNFIFEYTDKFKEKYKLFDIMNFEKEFVTKFDDKGMKIEESETGIVFIKNI